MRPLCCHRLGRAPSGNRPAYGPSPAFFTLRFSRRRPPAVSPLASPPSSFAASSASAPLLRLRPRHAGRRPSATPRATRRRRPRGSDRRGDGAIASAERGYFKKRNNWPSLCDFRMKGKRFLPLRSSLHPLSSDPATPVPLQD